jgi:hypothetical protein
MQPIGERSAAGRVSLMGWRRSIEMASRAEIYEVHAKVCERQAQLLKDPEAKEAYLELAKIWRRMACDFGVIDRQSIAGALGE